MNKKAIEDYNEMATAMDKRDFFLFKLKDWVMEHGEIPEEFQEDYEAFRRDRFKSWRTMPKVVKRIQRAAKRSAKAPGLDKLTERDSLMIKGLQQTDFKKAIEGLK